MKHIYNCEEMLLRRNLYCESNFRLNNGLFQMDSISSFFMGLQGWSGQGELKHLNKKLTEQEEKE